jgi:hypothetical protein
MTRIDDEVVIRPDEYVMMLMNNKNPRYLPMHLLLVALLLLAGCGGAPGATPGTPATQPPAATSAPAPTSISLKPTTAPTVAPPTVAPPTATTPPEPTAAPTAPPTPLPTTAPTPPPPTTAPTPPPSDGAGAIGAEILFLRNGALVAFDIATRAERILADDVHNFSASADGQAIALIRGAPEQTEIWRVDRSGANLTRLTQNDRVEASVVWSPDRQALIFASAPGGMPFTSVWPEWSHWCAASEVRVLNLADGGTFTLGAGCDPAVSPDGRRVAFSTAPTTAEEGFGVRAPMAVNSIRLVNRQGQNGWDFARALGAPEGANNGQLVYAPAWAPDGARLAYHRYLGMMIEVDVNLSEIGGSFEGRGQPFGEGAGWLQAPRFSPDGTALAVVENNFSDARGFGGYDDWSIAVIQLDGSREVAMPFGPVVMLGSRLDDSMLARGQAFAWAPDSASAAVLLPPGWRPDLPVNEPLGIDAQPGEIWRWRPGNQPDTRLVERVDFASPIAWLPPVA